MNTLSTLSSELFGYADDRFTPKDANIIETIGPSAWALQSGVIIEDRPFDMWPTLPAPMQSMILADCLEGLDLPMAYAVPFRFMGRVLLVAMLPAPQPAKPRQEVITYIDPPIPMPILGMMNRVTLASHKAAITNFLKTNEAAEINDRLPAIVKGLAVYGQAKRGEVSYYLTAMRALAAGSWRHVDAFIELARMEQQVAGWLREGQAPQTMARRALLQGGRS